MIAERELTPDDYIAMLRRRAKVILIPAVFAPLIGFLVSYALPSKYTSQSLILVEQQRVPEEMVKPAVLVIATPIVVGTLFGVKALAGVLAGSLVSGLVMALASSNAGGAWDNAKKYIEGGQHGGKGSDTHKAAVVGDTVGDPFKDTSGPSLNILMKLMAILSLVFAPFFEAHGGILLRLFGME